MKRLVKPVALALTVLAALLPVGCDTTDGDKGCTQPSYCTTGNQQHQLTLDASQAANADPCVYNAVRVDCSGCQLSGLNVEGAGWTQTPTDVTFEWNGTPSDRSVNPSVNWTATTNALTCGTGPGCADGTYVFKIKNPSKYNCADFGTVTLEIELN